MDCIYIEAHAPCLVSAFDTVTEALHLTSMEYRGQLPRLAYLLILVQWPFKRLLLGTDPLLGLQLS